VTWSQRRACFSIANLLGVYRLDDLTPGTPHSLGKNANGSAKRKLDFETPSRPRGGKLDTNGKTGDFASPLRNGSGVDGAQ
jgi:DNA polymerase alpha subunit B